MRTVSSCGLATALVLCALPASAQTRPATPTNLKVSANGTLLQWTQPASGAPTRGWNVYRNNRYTTTVHQRNYAIPAGAREGNRYYVVAFDFTPGVPFFSSKSREVLVSSGVPVAPPPPTTTGVDSSSATDSWLRGRRRVIWSDEFNGRRGARPDPKKWTFATGRHRTGYLTKDHASLDGEGHLVMRAVVKNNRAEMSYLKSFDDISRGWDLGFPDDNDFLLDPTQGPVYLETSVRFDKAQRAFRAWWAFWLMSPNASYTREPYAPYDGNVNTGAEVDIFEYVPDVSKNGFNMAIFTTQNVSSGLHPYGRMFTSENARTFRPGGRRPLNVNLVDGRYHRIGFYCSQSRYAFYLDDKLVYTTTDRRWITRFKKNGLRLTWESEDGNVWGATPQPGKTFVTENTRAEVSIDYVRVSRIN